MNPTEASEYFERQRIEHEAGVACLREAKKIRGIVDCSGDVPVVRTVRDLDIHVAEKVIRFKCWEVAETVSESHPIPINGGNPESYYDGAKEGADEQGD